MALISFGALPCRGKKKKLDDSSRLDVVEIARVPEMLPRLFPSWSGQGLISTPVHPFDGHFSILISLNIEAVNWKSSRTTTARHHRFLRDVPETCCLGQQLRSGKLRPYGKMG